MNYSYNYNTSLEGQILTGIFIFLMIALVIGLAIGITAYIIQGISLMNVATDKGLSTWMAWVPIVNIYLIIKVVKGKTWIMWTLAVYFIAALIGSMTESLLLLSLAFIALIWFAIYQMIVVYKLGKIYDASKVLFWVGIFFFPCYFVYFIQIGKEAKRRSLGNIEATDIY